MTDQPMTKEEFAQMMRERKAKNQRAEQYRVVDEYGYSVGMNARSGRTIDEMVWEKPAMMFVGKDMPRGTHGMWEVVEVKNSEVVVRRKQ